MRRPVQKDTFFSDIHVSSIYPHDTRIGEQDKSGWVSQRPRIYHGDVSAHQQQLCQEASSRIRVIMLEQHADLVAGNLNLATNKSYQLSTQQYYRRSFCRHRFSNAALPTHGGRVQPQVNGQMCAGFFNHWTPMKKENTITRGVLSPIVPWVFPKKIKFATMRYCCTWTLLQSVCS